MKIVTRSSSSQPDLGWGSYSIVEITKELRDQVLARREIFQMVQSKDPTILSLSFWDCSAEFFDNLDTVKFTEDFKNNSLQILEDNFSPCFGDENEEDLDGTADYDEDCRTECDCLVIEERGFYWRAIVKHTDTYVETTLIPYDWLMEQKI